MVNPRGVGTASALGNTSMETVVGLDTIPVMQETGTTILAVEAGRTLMLDKSKMIDAANAAGIAIVGHDA